VVFDFTGTFAKEMSILLGRPLDAHHANSWNFSAWMGVDDYKPYIHSFLASESFGHLPAKTCAAIVLPALAAAGHPLYAITSCSTERSIVSARLRNIENVFGPIFEDVRFVPIDGSKVPDLIRIAEHTGGPGLWLEDNPQNARDGAALGFETFVVRTPSNRLHEAFCDDPALTWVDDLFSVAYRLDLHHLLDDRSPLTKVPQPNTYHRPDGFASSFARRTPHGTPPNTQPT
jgi:hypothetical protein